MAAVASAAHVDVRDRLGHPTALLVDTYYIDSLVLMK
jgi:hypothetical protein